MKHIIITIFCLILFLMSACSGGQNSKSEESVGANDIKFVTLTTTENISNTGVRNILGEMKVSVEMKLPSYYIDDSTSKKMLLIIASEIDVPDTAATSAAALFDYVSDVTKKRFSDDSSEVEIAEADDITGHKMNVQYFYSFSPVYDANGILSYRQKLETRYGNENPAEECRYFNINLSDMQLLALDDIFNMSSIRQINEMLKAELLKQNKVDSDKELIEKGYFNLDNLYAGNNFYVTNSGLTWSFLPLELGCFNVGETEISLSYEVLKPFFVENCPLNKLAK